MDELRAAPLANGGSLPVGLLTRSPVWWLWQFPSRRTHGGPLSSSGLPGINYSALLSEHLSFVAPSLRLLAVVNSGGAKNMHLITRVSSAQCRGLGTFRST